MPRSLMLGSVWVLIVALAGACDSSSSSSGSGSSGAGAAGSDPGVCPGTDPWPDGTPICRSDDDCDSSSYCASAMDPNTCGGCVPMYQGCSDDTDCGAGVCDPFTQPQGPCQCEPAMICVSNCNDAGCADGFQCETDGHCSAVACGAQYTCPDDRVCDATAQGTDAHGCGPKPCDAGYACSGDDVCEPGAPGADTHGCRPLHCFEGHDCGPNMDCVATPSGNGCVSLTCTLDADCDCGACLGGVCAPRIGACFGYAS